ncbi:MAG: membrane integrity-associated transporter subunit PqiC [Desulfobacterales bacterium]|nr:membrane integrity-associated transporter subunit PqiC [Desulfobacterales bacterium]
MKLKIFILFFLFIIIGCFSKKHSIKIEYYTVDYESLTYSDFKQLPVTIRVEHFLPAPFYKSDKINYSSERFKRDFYEYHRWRAYPDDIISYFIERDFKNSALFKGVFNVNSTNPVSYVVQGTVEDFFEQDSVNKWEAVVSLSVTLIDDNESNFNKKILFQKTYTSKKECKEKTAKSLAEAMSLAMKDVSNSIILDVYNFISTN